jgi:hypothetical protein
MMYGAGFQMAQSGKVERAPRRGDARAAKITRGAYVRIRVGLTNWCKRGLRGGVRTITRTRTWVTWKMRRERLSGGCGPRAIPCCRGSGGKKEDVMEDEDVKEDRAHQLKEEFKDIEFRLISSASE